MKKKDFIRLVASRTDLTFDQVERVIEEVAKVSAERLAVAGEVRIPDLVALRAKHYNARAARNPKSGVPVTIPAGVRVRVRPVTAFEKLFDATAAKADNQTIS